MRTPRTPCKRLYPASQTKKEMSSHAKYAEERGHKAIECLDRICRHNYGQQGRFKSDCPNPRLTQCRECGKYGHAKRDCHCAKKQIKLWDKIVYRNKAAAEVESGKISLRVVKAVRLIASISEKESNQIIRSYSVILSPRMSRQRDDSPLPDDDLYETRDSYRRESY